MRTRVALPVALALFAAAGLLACGVSPAPPMSSCTNKFDCASNEVCEQGLCVPQSESPAKREDAGAHYERPDGGADAGMTGTPDSGQADSGQTIMDAGTLPDAAADSGVDAGFDAGCAAPISVDGFAGFCTIGAAIAAANNNALIEVPAGTYAETLDIAKPVTLHGNGTALIQGSAGIPPLRLRADGIIVDNFTIQAAATNGIEVASSATINAVTINGAAGVGITINLSGTTVSITGATINAVDAASSFWGEGIEVNAGAVVTVTGSQITDAAYLGIVNIGGTLTVDSTRIDRPGRAYCQNDPERCGYGIVSDNAVTTVQNNTVIDSSASAGSLIYQAQFTMSNSAITNSGQRVDVWAPGILIDGGDPVYVNNNNISENQDEGIGCWTPGPDNVDGCSGNTHQNNATWTNCPGC